MTKEVFCGECEYYHPKSLLVNTGELNVSGKLARYRVWLNCCSEGHNKKGYHCIYYEPNEAKRIRNEKFEQGMKQLQLVGSENA